MNLWDYKPRRKPNPRPAAEKLESHEVCGTVENIVYRDDNTTYTVCDVRNDNGSEMMKVVGKCPAIWVGETVKAAGKWSRHKQHGYQFEAETIQCVAPTSVLGIEKYLSSGMIPGIGKVMAHRIVKKFGAKTLDIIEKESGRLGEIKGIGKSRRQEIKDAWIAQKGIRDIMVFLQSHGIGNAQAARIFKTYGQKANDLIMENPYRLCSDIWGIGFKTADKVAVSVGVPPESEKRARAGVRYVLSTLSDEGHCFCTEAELILYSAELLSISAEVLAEAIRKEVAECNLVKDRDRIYLAALHRAEVSVAETLTRLMKSRLKFRPIEVDKAVPWAAEKMKISFAPMQSEALRTVLSEKVSIITGGPGVGKTTIIKALVDVYARRGLAVVLAAPTGRAAKRMSEATAHEATTIHRLLKYQPGTRTFEHGHDLRLEGDVFILDEVSMVDISLMSSFLEAIPNGAALVFVGDSDQLPSVGPGNVLRDMIGSGAIPCRKLETIFRQEKGGLIVRNAHNVNSGEFIASPAPGEESDFYFIEADEPAVVIERVLGLLTDRIPKRFGFEPLTDIQVLTPMRKNELGADNLNILIQDKLNPAGPCIEKFGRKYRCRDRVMQIRNNYDKGVFNGDIGQVSAIEELAYKVTVDFDGRMVTYDYGELDEMVHAYACSIHKSQGSEFPAVVILMTTQHFKLLQRNLLYTAITRGRKLVCLVGSRKAVHIAIRNNEIRLRRTGLMERLAHATGNRVVVETE